MVRPAFDDWYWAAVDKTMSHVVHAVADLSGNNVVFKGGSHLRLCIVDLKHLGHFRRSEDLDFEWEGAESAFWDMFRKALVAAADTSGHEMIWSPRGDRFWWGSPGLESQEGHIKIDYRQRGDRPVGWYSIWNPQNDPQLPPRRIRGFTPESVALDKIATLVSYRRSKARDIYDLWFLSHYGYVNIAAAWNEYSRQSRIRIDVETLLDEIIDNQYDAYAEDWEETSAKNVYPPGLVTADQFEELIEKVFYAIGGQGQ